MWYLVHGARVVGAFEMPTDVASKKTASESIANIYRTGAGLLDSYEHADSMMVVMQWFRKYQAERNRCMSPEIAIG
jgi:hypothetical protein